MQHNGHFTFCVFYGRVCCSFAKHSTPRHNEFQCCPYLQHIPFTVLYNRHSDLSILSQRCFQNLIGCRIIFIVISPSLFQSWCTFLDLCVNFLFFFERMNCRGSMNIQISYGCHYLLSQFGYTTTALILFQVIFSSVLLIILKGEACENNCCFISVKTQFNVPYPVYHETYLSNFSLTNRSFSSLSSLSLCHPCYW